MRGLASLTPSWVPPRPCEYAAEVPAVLPVHVLAVPQIQFTIRVPNIPVVCLAGPVVVQSVTPLVQLTTLDACSASAPGF